MNFKLTYLLYTVILLLTALPFNSTANDQRQVMPSGKVLSDTIEVGQPFFYSLTFKHAARTELFFPDSSYDFSPFQFMGQQFFTTRTDEKGSLDSTVYKLIAYEVAPLLQLSLPVFLLTNKDCTAVFAQPDTVFVKLSVSRKNPETLSLQTENLTIPLGLDFNYSVMLLSLVLTGVFGFGIYWFFGKALSQQWQLFQLQRRHRDFLRSFAKLNPETQDGLNLSNAENAVILWKKYLQRILKKPFATYTTKEILDNFESNSLAEALQEIDRAIYGQMQSSKVMEAMQVLRDVAQTVYRNKRREIADTDLRVPDKSTPYNTSQ